ncbi:MAG TPA: putative glycoside hydrolase, partial [Longimicrobium sp.]|nr:putative glycoside hydrolase [Longimicrobium sp.]
MRRIRPLAAVLLAVLAAACGGKGTAEKGAAGDSAAVAKGDSAAPAQAAVQSPRAKAPPIIRGLYVNAYKAGSGTHRKRLIEIADSTEINAFVVDMKDERGLHYVSDLALQNELTEDSEITIRNPRAFVDTLKAHGIWTIA